MPHCPHRMTCPFSQFRKNIINYDIKEYWTAHATLWGTIFNWIHLWWLWWGQLKIPFNTLWYVVPLPSFNWFIIFSKLLNDVPIYTHRVLYGLKCPHILLHISVISTYHTVHYKQYKTIVFTISTTSCEFWILSDTIHRDLLYFVCKSM